MNSRELLKNIIANDDPVKWASFFSAKTSGFGKSEEPLMGYENDYFSDCKLIGDIEFRKDGQKVLVISIKVLKELSERSSRKAQYTLAKKILKDQGVFDAGIFIFYDSNGCFRFSLVHEYHLGTKRTFSNFKRYTYFVGPSFTNKTFLSQIGDKDFRDYSALKEAFSLAAVTNEFYKEFLPKYEAMWGAVRNNFGDAPPAELAQNFALLFTIRIVFIGFIQKRKWLGDNETFLQHFQKEYREQGLHDQFYTTWLRPLLFEALAHPPGRKVSYGNNTFSKETELALQMAPYLNGGLFLEKTGFDDKDFFIPDKEIEDFFEFLFSYNFTIEENSLDDEDLQLNPEFLGIIFERLVNKKDGAVYTPRTEVDLMCRLSLVKWLQQNNTTKIPDRDLYELFFKEGGADAADDEQRFGSFSVTQYKDLLNLLENITICDPASGSGAFPVGMLHVLDEVEQHIRNRIIDPEYALNSFERKKRIISNSLYGAEVKEWAVWICQLRLWITLFIDASDDLKLSQEAILPSLDFKIRCGDSLVQRIGNKLFPVQGHADIKSHLKAKVTKLKQLKTDYFSNKIRSIQMVRKAERDLFSAIINDEIIKRKEKLNAYQGNSTPNIQENLFGDTDIEPKNNVSLFKESIEALETEIEKLNKNLRALLDDHPLIWNIEFSEIFAEKGGFDLVIGNPPYVRQEQIADPNGIIKDNKVYKGLLQEMVATDFPDYFYNRSRSKLLQKIDLKSDLYAYFYIRSLRLLNPKGLLTFICSNSWLDVGYGTWLQRFLLHRAPVHFILDNHSKRSFEAADVNTIISIIGAPQRNVAKDHLVKFVAFKKSFEDVIFTENLLWIEESNKTLTNDDFRVYPMTNSELLDTGSEYEHDRQAGMGTYIGDKWGGKYLKSPEMFLDIYYSNKVFPFNEIVDIKYGVKPGKVNFFYLDEATASKHAIEKKYLIPAVVSSQHFDKIFIEPTHYIFTSTESKSEMLGTNALKYINNGEKQKMNSGASVEAHRPFWYTLKWEYFNTIFFRFWDKRFFSPISIVKMICSDNFCYGNFKINDWCGKILVNSTFYFLQIELFGNSNQGQGVLTTYMEHDYPYIRLPKINENDDLYRLTLKKINQRAISDIFTESGIDPLSDIPISKQDPSPLPDRAALDKIVFDALDLTEKERKEVYRAVCQLVWNRLSKARSV
jgi:hypothetical protein